MIKRINTNVKKKRIDVWLSAKAKKLIAIGFDPMHDNTEYFFRLMKVDGVVKFTFNMPLTPKFLDLLIFELSEGHKANSSLFKVQKMTVNDLAPEPMFLDHFTAEFVTFANNFAKKAGYLPSGTYLSKKKNFKIVYIDKIPDVRTPSRIHSVRDYIEVSQEFFHNMTIPARLNILFHEFAHNFLNEDPDSEIEADNHGIKMYLGLGHSSIESVYSLTRIFKDIDSHVERLYNLDAKLKKYNHDRDFGFI